MHYDVFISTDILFEKDTAGGIFPSSDVHVFRPSYRETENELVLFIVELVLMLFAAYILVAVGLQEQKHKQRLHRAGMLYYITLNGICDTMTVLAIVTSFSWRFGETGRERASEVLLGVLWFLCLGLVFQVSRLWHFCCAVHSFLFLSSCFCSGRTSQFSQCFFC